MNTWQYLINEYKKRRDRKDGLRQSFGTGTPPPQPANIPVATIAIILDGEVQEVIRAQDRMAALFLSEPSFVEIPEDLPMIPTIGWSYSNGTFIPPVPEDLEVPNAEA